MISLIEIPSYWSLELGLVETNVPTLLLRGFWFGFLFLFNILWRSNALATHPFG